ncbi:peptide synthetase [Streptomyces cinnamoneus]|uniref:Peptide synthetase n=1 Tax=Streptomyces cinnamoneus TaxID=53446 RepID=A0A2G1XIT1_STRCJ|nr:amino acid adenylation domain-containing protein [Streptomyces cinnamoneus]PHQ51154.1 peptide synthetase [Streptomyces cinnamoneus]PPT13623.1 peptide synthetase [Streptomyces cinnamoneus]
MTLHGLRAPLPDDTVVHRVFEAHAHRNPLGTALTCGDEQISYAELNTRANRFAHHLLSLDIGRGSVVGVCLDRTPELMVAILGVLKSGAAYAPLDPTYPQERLDLMLSNLDQLEYTVVAPATESLIGHAHTKVLDIEALAPRLALLPAVDPQTDTTGDDLCYAVFTSGSTGTPKAVAVRHEGWYNLLNWLALEYGLDERSSSLSVSSFGFDISQRGLMAPLFTGAPLHLLPSRSFDVNMAYRVIAERGVATLHCAPSTLYLLIERDMAQAARAAKAAGTEGGPRCAALAGVDYVFIGGEPLSTPRVEEWATQEGNACTLLHQYGVAECTDVASSYPLHDYPRYRAGATPVGRPVYNTAIRLMEERDGVLTEVPDGETGEICISGTSVGAGYLGASPADMERFMTADTGGERVRLYRTGDRGHATASGDLVVVGRVDAQVKIRGMRIDLGDVEHGVRANPRVEDVVVLAPPDGAGEARLVAFVIPAAAPLDPRALRAELLGSLPRNMVPQEVVELTAFPLNPNGKVDRKALAASVDHPATSQ